MQARRHEGTGKLPTNGTGLLRSLSGYLLPFRTTFLSRHTASIRQHPALCRRRPVPNSSSAASSLHHGCLLIHPPRDTGLNMRTRAHKVNHKSRDYPRELPYYLQGRSINPFLHSPYDKHSQPRNLAPSAVSLHGAARALRQCPCMSLEFGTDILQPGRSPQ